MLQNVMHDQLHERKFVTVCMYCERQNFEETIWGPKEIETQAGKHIVSHGLCPDCMETVAVPQMNGTLGIRQLARKTLRFNLQNRLNTLAPQAT